MFDFEKLEPWDPSKSSPLLPVGTHLVTISSAVSSKTKKGYNQIEIDAGNDGGSRKDWIVYAEENGARKVVALARATGVRLPTEEDQGDDGQLTDAYVALFVGKCACMVVGLKDSLKNPGQQEPRAQGWLPPEAVTADAPADSRGLPQGNGGADADIPF